MIRKVMMATINYDHPQLGMIHAFDGIFPGSVQDFDFYEMERSGRSRPLINAEFVEQALAFKPDWIWLQVQDSEVLTADTILEVRRRLPKCVVSHWNGDCRTQVSKYLSSFCTATQLTLTSSVGQLPMFAAAGAHKVRYCQVAVDWHEDVVGAPEWKPPFEVPDVVFIGNYYGDRFPGTAERVSAVKALMRVGIKVGIVGDGWPMAFPVIGKCLVKQQIHVYRKAKVALSINHFSSVDRFYSDRQLIAMASGTPVVARGVPGLEEDVEGCYIYRDDIEIEDFVREAMSERGRLMGAKARACVLRRHTWFHRILDVLPVIEEIQREMP